VDDSFVILMGAHKFNAGFRVLC